MVDFENGYKAYAGNLSLLDNPKTVYPPDFETK